MKQGQVTVVIVNYNSEGLLEKCLTCLGKQSLKPHNILVVDNGSSDDSIRKALKTKVDFELIRSPVNIGFAAANNLALDKVKTEYVATLNPDAFPAPGWLHALISHANQNNPVSSFASCQLMFEKQSFLDGTGDLLHFSGVMRRRGYGKSIDFLQCAELEVFSACAGAAMYRTDVVTELGGFDEDFFCYAEDIDLGFRLRLKGHDCHFVREAQVLHIGSATTGKDSDFSIYHGQRNMVWVFVKNMPPILLVIFALPHLLMNLLMLFYFWRKGRFRVVFRAKCDALAGMKRMMVKRRLIQRERCVGAKRILAALSLRVLWARG